MFDNICRLIYEYIGVRNVESMWILQRRGNSRGDHRKEGNQKGERSQVSKKLPYSTPAISGMHPPAYMGPAGLFKATRISHISRPEGAVWVCFSIQGKRWSCHNT